MKMRELFEVLVRVIGVWQFAEGIANLPYWIRTLLQAHIYEQFPVPEIAMTVVQAAARIVVGLVLFFAARWLVAKTYPEPQATQPSQSTG